MHAAPKAALATPDELGGCQALIGGAGEQQTPQTKGILLDLCFIDFDASDPAATSGR